MKKLITFRTSVDPIVLIVDLDQLSFLARQVVECIDTTYNNNFQQDVLADRTVYLRGRENVSEWGNEKPYITWIWPMLETGTTPESYFEQSVIDMLEIGDVWSVGMQAIQQPSSSKINKVPNKARKKIISLDRFESKR